MGKMLEEMEKAKKEAEEKLEKTLLLIKKADKIARAVKPFLPKGWKIAFEVYWGGLSIESGQDYFSTFEFRNVCDIVEKIINKKLDRRINKAMGQDNTERLACLRGSAYVMTGDDVLMMGVDVAMYPESGKQTECEIEYEEKVVKIAKIDPGCLGRSKFDKRKEKEAK